MLVMAISKISFDKVYGVVMTTADGEEYGLHHVTNIWRGTELGFDADDAYYASMIGKTITQITYYTADGVYVLPVNVAVPAANQSTMKRIGRNVGVPSVPPDSFCYFTLFRSSLRTAHKLYAQAINSDTQNANHALSMPTV